MDKHIALIGLGVIGIPIAHKLYKKYGDRFMLVANGERRRKLTQTMYVNNELFCPKVISDKQELDEELDLLIVCIKNYDIQKSVNDIKKVVTEKTIILPLQNGITSYQFFKKTFPNNIILQGYVQGPNTVKNNNVMRYQNSGMMHIGDPNKANMDLIQKIYDILLRSGIEVYVEQEITKMVWKKWMLNVAGNSITALTGADYSQFKKYTDLQELCIKSMKEFLVVANMEGVCLNEEDIKDVTDYYISYNGNKKTKKEGNK